MPDDTVRTVLARLDEAVMIRGVRRSLGDCTAVDLEQLALEHERVSLQLQGLADTVAAGTAT